MLQGALARQPPEWSVPLPHPGLDPGALGGSRRKLLPFEVLSFLPHHQISDPLGRCSAPFRVSLLLTPSVTAFVGEKHPRS